MHIHVCLMIFWWIRSSHVIKSGTSTVICKLLGSLSVLLFSLMILLDGAPMDDNQVKCFIIAHRGQSFKDVLSGKQLATCSVFLCGTWNRTQRFPDWFAWLKSDGLTSYTEGFLFAPQAKPLSNMKRQNMIFDMDVHDSKVCHKFSEFSTFLLDVLLWRKQHIEETWRHGTILLLCFDNEFHPWYDHDHAQGFMENEYYKCLLNVLIYNLTQMQSTYLHR